MGKKKSSLKPVQRGFATTSVASKKPVEEPIADESPPSSTKERVPQLDTQDIPSTGHSDDAAAEGAKEDWEDEKAAEDAALQTLVERLHEKGEKEVSRVLKAIEYDKRLAVSFPRLDINPDIRQRILDLALDDDDAVAEGQAVRSIKGTASPVDRDKALIRLFVTLQVLQRLGFSDERIEESVMKGVGDGEGWEKAIEWLWLHLPEDECLVKNEFSANGSQTQSGAETPLPLMDEVQVETSAPESDDSRRHARIAAKSVAPMSKSATTEASSLFQPQDGATSDTSDSEEDPDLNKVNETWANLMLELDNLRIAAGAAKSKGKKAKSSGVVLETPQMRRVREKINKVEKEYMFSRKDADPLLKALKAKRDTEAFEARLRGVSVTEPASEDLATSATEDPDTEGGQRDAEEHSDRESEQEEEGGLFGNLLDEPTSPPDESANTTIYVRPMPIPRQHSFSGIIPKNILKEALKKASKQAVMTFARLSGHSKAARAGLEISWSPIKRRQWRMEDIACEDMAEAENYVSTLALHDLLASGELNHVNWKVLPPAYRDLWEELDLDKRSVDDAKKREIWKLVTHLLEKKGSVKAIESTAAMDKDGPAEVSATTGSIPSRASDPRLQAEFERRRSSAAYQRMLQQRNTLPIAAFRQAIVETLDHAQIMVLSGETGCGKSTQLPSFILEDQLSRGQPCKIFVTEPRRISAISLAQRVSQELGDLPGAMGTNASLVGYSIRLEAKVSAATRLAFVTNGIALRMLEGSSTGSNGKGTAFDEVTHIIIDEVHERSIESDFLLIVLKSLMVQRPDLKVVLMSATLDADKISAFFGGCPVLQVPGRTFPVQVNYLEDAVEVAGWHIDETSNYAVRSRKMKSGKQLEWTEEAARSDGDEDDDEGSSDPMKLSSTRYSARTVSTVNLLDSRQIPYDLIVALLETICFMDQTLINFSSAVLVFMPGLAEIRRLTEMLNSHPAFGASGDFVIYPLHSTISSEGQSAVFDIPPNGMRKIVISTNIAETGVTIPDITCVIDSGKHREMRYDEKRQLSRLVETYIARSNAKQRRGRAGRVQEGLAFHLFTKARHDTQLAEHPIPEMLRLSLQDLALRIKILRVKLGTSIEDVLSKAMDPPTSLNIQKAIAALVEVKALTANEDITPMGRLLSKLPMDVHLGKFLLVAAMFRCLDPALTIAATLNSKSPFITPFGFESQADAAKKGFAVGNSDFLTIANVFESWRRASDNTNFVRTFCKKNFVSHQNLQQIEELRQQLLAYLVDTGFVSVSDAERREISSARFSRNSFRTRFVAVPQALNVNASSLPIVSAALASGLYPKILSIVNNELHTITNNQPVAIHPSSVNFRLPKSEFGSTQLVYFTLMQSKKLYAWEVGPVDDRGLVALCGDLADFKIAAGSLILDRRLRYRVDGKTSVALSILREKLAQAMSAKMRGRALSEKQEAWFQVGVDCLNTGIWDDTSVRAKII